MSGTPDSDELLRTPLYAEHMALGARMVPFAGYTMPVQYPTGVLKEHLHTRAAASLFEVSHMGQAVLADDDDSFERVAEALEALVPANILELKPGQQRYSQLLNDAGGIIDDLMVTRPENINDGHLYLVLNASRKAEDVRHIARHLPSGVRIEIKPDRALIAIQGPKATDVLSKLCPKAGGLAFMHAAKVRIGTIDCHVSRSGYTGEDGFEISVAAADAAALWRELLGSGEVVAPCGLGARDTLRLEAGLCLYGNDIDETTSPIEANLAWSIPKRRRASGGFPGASRITSELANGPKRVRVGLRAEGRMPVRAGAPIFLEAEGGTAVGTITSGAFAPSLSTPVAMGYVPPKLSDVGKTLFAEVRGQRVPLTVVRLPFVPARYKRD